MAADKKDACPVRKGQLAAPAIPSVAMSATAAAVATAVVLL